TTLFRSLRLPEPRESLGEAGVAERVVVHDDAAPGGVHHADELVDRALDRVAADVALEVGHRAGHVEESRPLVDEIRGGHWRRGPLEVRGEDEPLALGRIHDRQRDNRAERGSVDAVRERRRDGELDVGLATPGAVRALDARLAVPRLPERLAPLRLLAADHPPRNLTEHGPACVA